MVDLLIQNCDVLRQNINFEVQKNQDILIEKERIVEIRPAQPFDLIEVQEIIEGTGLLAIPGLINTHAHVPMVLFRGLAEDTPMDKWLNDFIWPLEANLTPEDIYWGALLGIAEMIEAGITCVADHYFAMDYVAQAVANSGIRANLSWTVFEHQGMDYLDRTCQFVQDWNGKSEGRITTWLGPHAPYTTSPEFLRVTAERAQAMGVGIHTHVSETKQQVQHCLDQYHLTPIQVLENAGVLDGPTILAHCLSVDDQDLEIIAKSPHTGIAHSPKTYMKLAMEISPLRRLMEKGIAVGLATDGVVSSNTLDIFEQMRLMALTQKDLTQDAGAFTLQETLEVAFSGSARVIGAKEESGSLQPGKLADIVLLRRDRTGLFPCHNPLANLVYSTISSDVDTVICNGKLLMENGRLRTIDKAEVIREVSGRVERLAQRTPGVRIAEYKVANR